MITLSPTNSRAEASISSKFQQQKFLLIDKQKRTLKKIFVLALFFILVFVSVKSSPAAASTPRYFPPPESAINSGEPSPPAQPLFRTQVSAPIPDSPAVIQLEAPVAALTPDAEIKTATGIEHVVLITIDGLRPDALALADTPNLDKLINKGAFSPNAQSVWCSFTLPSHASMLTGMFPEKTDVYTALPYIGWPGMNGPTMFSVAHEAGFSTAMIFGKQKMNYLVLPNSVDTLFGEDVHDTEVKDQTIELIEEGLSDILFVHFPDTDRVGHEFGWMSDNQLYAINFADNMVGEVVAALDREDYLDSTLLIITADHGGHGFNHGDDSAVDKTTPWLAVGPGVPQGVIINSPISIVDNAATVLHALDLPLPEIWDGKPVLEIFQ